MINIDQNVYYDVSSKQLHILIYIRKWMWFMLVIIFSFGHETAIYQITDGTNALYGSINRYILDLHTLPKSYRNLYADKIHWITNMNLANMLLPTQTILPSWSCASLTAYLVARLPYVILWALTHLIFDKRGSRCTATPTQLVGPRSYSEQGDN